jgi:Leu/Phe-tRNA-protein transferase
VEEGVTPEDLQKDVELCINPEKRTELTIRSLAEKSHIKRCLNHEEIRVKIDKKRGKVTDLRLTLEIR